MNAERYRFPPKKRDVVNRVLTETADSTGVPEITILSKIKTKVVSRARHKWLYDCEVELDIGCSRLATLTGFDHATVLYAFYWHAKRNRLPEFTQYDGSKHRDQVRVRRAGMKS